MSNQVPSTDRQLPTRPEVRELFAEVAKHKGWTLTEASRRAIAALVQSDKELAREFGRRLTSAPALATS